MAPADTVTPTMGLPMDADMVWAGGEVFVEVSARDEAMDTDEGMAGKEAMARGATLPFLALPMPDHMP